MSLVGRAIAVGALVGALASGFVASASASFRIDHAFVPGIGRVGTTLPSNTEVRPPGYIPPGSHATGAEFEKQRQREYRLSARTPPGRDVGPAEKIKRIKHDFARYLFLSKVALTCKPFPKAGRWIYRYVFLPPGRHPYSSQFEFERVQSQNANPGCTPFRLKVVRWRGVRVGNNGDRARLVMRGNLESDRGANGTWDTSFRFIWKAAVRRKDGRWHITTIAEIPLDDIGD